MAKNIINQWDPHFLKRSPLFSDLRKLLNDPFWPEWPGCEALSVLFPEPVMLSSGLQLSMHPQDETLPHPEMGYEERIFKTGIISTREQNWHDLFNAFIWRLFPKTKTALNTLHMDELLQQPGKKRTPARDAITHFDESGFIFTYCHEASMQLLKNHHWQALFVENREQWWQTIGVYVFGHGMYEKAFTPFIGFTGKAYCLPVNKSFFSLPLAQQYLQLDKKLSFDFSHHKTLSNSRHLSPLPILGVPGWHPDNDKPEFYLNTNYFRPKSRG
jgi:hypothetical protein